LYIRNSLLSDFKYDSTDLWYQTRFENFIFYKFNFHLNIIFRWFSSFYWKFRSTNKYFRITTWMWTIWSISRLLGCSVSNETLVDFNLWKKKYENFSGDNKIMIFNHPSFSCCYWSLSGFKRAAWLLHICQIVYHLYIRISDFCLLPRVATTVRAKFMHPSSSYDISSLLFSSHALLLS
jgi:hypothetical protein